MQLDNVHYQTLLAITRMASPIPVTCNLTLVTTNIFEDYCFTITITLCTWFDVIRYYIS